MHHVARDAGSCAFRCHEVGRFGYESNWIRENLATRIPVSATSSAMGNRVSNFFKLDAASVLRMDQLTISQKLLDYIHVELVHATTTRQVLTPRKTSTGAHCTNGAHIIDHGAGATVATAHDCAAIAASRRVRSLKTGGAEKHRAERLPQPACLITLDCV